MKLIFILFTIFFTSFAFSFDLSGISDDQIRSVLLAALKRFHLKSPPVNSVSPLIIQNESSSSDTNFFDKLPLDGKINILDEFFDCKSLALLKTTNRHNSRIPDSFLFRRLTKFNPYYLVEDPIVNKLLLALISKHFVKSKNLESPHIYDELMLLIMKFNIGKLNFDLIPKKIYFYLIAFINETVRGINSSVELSKFKLLLSFFTLLRQHDMSESLQFFKENHLASNMFCFSPNINKDLDFLHSKPSKDEVLAHFPFDSLSIHDYMYFNPCHSKLVMLSIIEFYAERVRSDLLFEFDPKIIGEQAFKERFILPPNSQQSIERRMFSLLEYTHTVSICAIYREEFKVDRPQCYFYSRNVLNELSLKEFERVNGYDLNDGLLSSFLNSGSANLFMLELISAILRLNRTCSSYRCAIINGTYNNFMNIRSFEELISI
jgi:hypothetical protein